MPGFVAVLASEESTEPPLAQIVPGLFGVVGWEVRPDMLHYSQVAAGLAERVGRAALVACMPEVGYRVCLVFRRGRSPHSFTDARDAADQHFAGIGESCVADPVAEGLSLAGFDPTVGARLCSDLGKHLHER